MCKNVNARLYIFLSIFILHLRFLEKRVIFLLERNMIVQKQLNMHLFEVYFSKKKVCKHLLSDLLNNYLK